MEVLVKLSPSEEGDLKSAWFPGDIFNIKEDGFQWGKEEKEPFFTVIKMPGISVSSCKFLLGSWIQNDSGEIYRNSLWKWVFESEYFENKSSKITKTAKDLE